jgi:hypothetical protein
MRADYLEPADSRIVDYGDRLPLGLRLDEGFAVKRVLLAMFLAVGLWLVAPAALPAQLSSNSVAQEVRTLTGARTRIVWVQHTGDGTDIFAHGANLRLLGLDSDDGHGERELVPGEGSFCRPLITPDGDHVVFTNVTSRGVYIVNWDGSGLRELVRGIAAGVWRDPDTGQEWVYAQVGSEVGVNARNNPIWRFRIDATEVRELVWNKTPVNPDGFQISRDGKQVVSLFPWPHFGVATLPNDTVSELGQGCCASMAADIGNMAFHLLGDHRHLMVYSLKGAEDRWKVAVNTAPGVDGFEIYHPKWSNQSRYMAMCGPFRGKGGITAEIYLGRFDPTLHSIEGWVRVTTNDKGDFYPDVWVEPAQLKVLRFSLNGSPVMEPVGAN